MEDIGKSPNHAHKITNSKSNISVSNNFVLAGEA